MKRLLFLLLLPLLFSCHASKNNSIIVNSLWQCDNNSVIVAANVYAPKMIPATFEIFRDCNKNQVFDPADEMERYRSPILVPVNDLYLSQPIELNDLWKQGKIFIRVINGTDTLVHEISRCSNLKTRYTE